MKVLFFAALFVLYLANAPSESRPRPGMSFKIMPGMLGPLPVKHAIPNTEEEVKQNENENMAYHYGRKMGERHTQGMYAKTLLNGQGLAGLASMMGGL